ncbi:uncharacterized protein LOC107274765 isoform X2 [Cephus cinctus]|uniref:Fibroblast growth factor n=1 Tax=Cephus cinctus TaxID=211228 RepID=A0AAJ7CFP2_CEPCN|nr:uncharacterized protein LOC107274765 isoform X2 [Cephus cinctus]
MPTEVDTGGPWVLHCDYRSADSSIPIESDAPRTVKHQPEHNSRLGESSDRCSISDRNLLQRASCPIAASDDGQSPVTTRRPSGRNVARFQERKNRVGRRRSRRHSDEISRSSLFNCSRDTSNETSYSILEDHSSDRTLDPSKDIPLRDISSCGDSAKCRVPQVSGCTILGIPVRRPHQTRLATANDSESEQDSVRRSAQSLLSITTCPFANSRETLPGDTARYKQSLISSHSSTGSSVEQDRENSSNLLEDIVESSYTTRSIQKRRNQSLEELRTRWHDQDDAVCHDREDHVPSASSGLFATSKGPRTCPATRSYFCQLAFIIFLIIFGQSGLFRSNVIPLNAKFRAGFSALTIGTIVGVVKAAPIDLIGDAAIRAERSANLSHITGASRKIQMYIKNRHLQILPDGTVNGSNDDTSDYTIFQRTSVSRGQLRIQGVATCLYLCMDSCGLLYGSREYTEDCVFNETLEQHNYNTYSSVRWSTPRKTLYLGLNRRGQPRRVQARGHNLGRLSAYARVLTQVALPERVDALQKRMMGAHHNIRHQHNVHRLHNLQQQALCPPLPPQEKDGRDRFRCRKRKKRKKKKRRCREGETPGPQCEVPADSYYDNNSGSGEGPPQSKRSCEGAASEEACRRQALNTPSKKRKSRIEENVATDGMVGRAAARHQQQRKGPKGKKSPNSKKTNGAGDGQKKPNGINGKRKGVGPKRNSSHVAIRKKGSGRVTRTTLPIGSGSMMSPLSWYHGVSTTPSTGDDAFPRRRLKTPSPLNDVTEPSTKLKQNPDSRRGKYLGLNRRKSLRTTVQTPVLTTDQENTDDQTILASTTELPYDHPDYTTFLESATENGDDPSSDFPVSDEDLMTLLVDSTSPTPDLDSTDGYDDYSYPNTPLMLSLAETAKRDEAIRTPFPPERLAMYTNLPKMPRAVYARP